MKKKYLVVGDNITGPFMAACLRLNDLDCELVMSKSPSQQESASIVLTPSVTQLLGDTFEMAVPRGSVASRFISFDHAGNEISDVDLNRFRLEGVSPTFFVCERLRIYESLMSLCRHGKFACKILPENASFDSQNIQVNSDGTVRAQFTNMPYSASSYAKIICTSRSKCLVPDSKRIGNCCTNHEVIESAPKQRWLELSVPAIPDGSQGIFVPGSQELVEIITNATSKLIVKPMLLGSKLYFSILLSMREDHKNPRDRAYDARMYWQAFVDKWSCGHPEYINHTLFHPLIQHIKHHSDYKRYLVYRTPSFVLPEWVTHSGSVLRVGPSAYGMYADAVDIADSSSFTDCFLLAKKLKEENEQASEWLQTRRRDEVTQMLAKHKSLTDYTFQERGQVAYIRSRFRMKFLGQYRKIWNSILKPMVSIV